MAGAVTKLVASAAAQDQNKFLTAVAAHSIKRADSLLKAMSQLTEDLIAYQVSMDIVHLFEMVDIAKQNREGGVVTPAA